MKVNRRIFIASLISFTLIGIYHSQAISSAEKGWFGELTSTIGGAIEFVDDVRASLKRQGTEIDRQKVKPSVSEFNSSANSLLASLTSLRRILDRSSTEDTEIFNGASELTPRANRLIRAMEVLFIRMSVFDTALEKHRGTIYQLVAARSEAVQRIRAITIRPNGGKINRKLLRSEINSAIKISNALLQSIQALIRELG